MLRTWYTFCMHPRNGERNLAVSRVPPFVLSTTAQGKTFIFSLYWSDPTPTEVTNANINQKNSAQKSA